MNEVYPTAVSDAKPAPVSTDADVEAKRPGLEHDDPEAKVGGVTEIEILAAHIDPAAERK
jgi:hypothetical protein